ncbi:MAG: M48 family metallopeptidase, partial [Lactobacillales bacterium]|nr:M48 family metallopeptidase [Lactobacillales bacterium]
MKKILFENIELYVQKNRKARYIKLRINHKSEAVLVVPWLCSERQALEFARGHIDWIKKHQQTKSDDVKFEHGQKIELMGQELLIQNHPTARRGVWIEGDILYVSGDPAFSNRRITEFIKKAIYAYIQEKALHLAGKIGQRPNRISLKDTTSRWGSCSSQKNLNFSWKL